MARASKEGSIKAIYPNKYQHEFYSGGSATAIVCIGDRFHRHGFSGPWSMEGDCSVVRVYTENKPVNGLYKVKTLIGPFDNFGEGSSNRVFCWKGDNVKILDWRNFYYSPDKLFIGSLSFKFSFAAVDFLYRYIGSIQERSVGNIQKLLSKDNRKNKYIKYLFEDEKQFLEDWES